MFERIWGWTLHHSPLYCFESAHEGLPVPSILRPQFPPLLLRSVEIVEIAPEIARGLQRAFLLFLKYSEFALEEKVSL